MSALEDMRLASEATTLMERLSIETVATVRSLVDREWKREARSYNNHSKTSVYGYSSKWKALFYSQSFFASGTAAG